MKRIIRNVIIILVTLIISLSCIYLITKLYNSEKVFNEANLESYYDETFKFHIKIPRESEIKKKHFNDKNILLQLQIPIYCPGIIKSKSETLVLNVIEKNSFENYIKNNRILLINEGVNYQGEKFIYGISPEKYRLYFFKYNDYTFEIKQPLSSFDFSGSKLKELCSNKLIPSFKRNLSIK